MTKAAANTVFRQSGYTPQQVDVVELHDCFSANELISYEALGLCAPGQSACFYKFNFVHTCIQVRPVR